MVLTFIAYVLCDIIVHVQFSSLHHIDVSIARNRVPMDLQNSSFESSDQTSKVFDKPSTQHYVLIVTDDQ